MGLVAALVMLTDDEFVPTYFVDDADEFRPPPTSSTAHLTVLSETLAGNALADLLGILPDERWDRGEKPHAPGKYAGISVGSRLPDLASPDAHLADLLDRLDPVGSNVRALVADHRVFSVRLWVYHRIPNWNPGLSFAASLIERISSLGTGLELDIFVTDPSAPIALNSPIDGSRPSDVAGH
jgi:hypothetical protein